MYSTSVADKYHGRIAIGMGSVKTRWGPSLPPAALAANVAA